MPAIAATVRAAAPRRAPSEQVRWLKARPGVSADALRIGSRILCVSDEGDRMLMPPGDPKHVLPYQRSRFVLPGAHWVVHSGDRYGFAGNSRAIYVTRTPLGPPIARRASPAPHKLFASAGGRKAVVALTHEGTVIRTTDLGRTWTITAENAVGVPEGIAMNHQGQGLLLTEPQAVWATLDDGATWMRVPSTGHGVTGVELGYNGSLWTTPIEPEGAPPLPDSLFNKGLLRVVPHDHSIQDTDTSYVQYLAADRVVLVAVRHSGDLQVALEPLEGALPPHWQELPGSKSCRDWLRVAAYGRASYVGCLDDRSSHFVVWENRGSGPWKRELEFDGSHDAGQFPLIAGPGGWLLYGEHIRPKTGAPAVRVEGPDIPDWQSVVVGGVVHLLGEDLAGDGYELYYARATHDQPLIKPIKLGVHARSASLFVDGTKVKVLAYSHSHVVAIDPLAGTDAPTAPFNTLPGTYLVLMHGTRGIALVNSTHTTGECWLAETADGGADWSKIPRENGGAYWPQGTDGPYCRPDGPSHCTASGCQLGQDIRLGWSLGGALPAPMPVAPASIPPVRKLGAPIGLVCTEVDYVPADDPAHAFAFRVGNGAFASTALSCRAATSPARSPASKAP